ncbi:hypothetical protein OCU04_000591 [Sclerotinia nivalis]|uniref:Kinesin light chain n=1 Tax=Sclerotinia nivalis TaxID=352851 RepID=A0A9X0DNW8_9HELO|nr:hypothetical protein OCU04_000591 [Sclerotinia nivalis]
MIFRRAGLRCHIELPSTNSRTLAPSAVCTFADTFDSPAFRSSACSSPLALRLKTLLCGPAASTQPVGQYQEAVTINQQALIGREKTLGRNYSETLRSLNNVGLVLENQEKYMEAENIYLQKLTAREQVLGKGTSRNATKNYQHWWCPLEPIRLHWDRVSLTTRSGRKRILGLDHPDTLQSISNLGKALENLDRPEEAELLFRQAVESKEMLLGNEYSHIQSAEACAGLVRKINWK